jgi:uncharacterized membrane protein YjfL (UPF0719 family)
VRGESRNLDFALKEDRVGEILFSLVHLFVGILLAALIAYLSFYLFQTFTRDIDEGAELRQGNPAIGMVLGAAIIAVAIILRPALDVDTSLWDAGKDVYIRTLLAQAVQIAIGLVLSAIALAVSIYLFARLTRGMDEIAELKKGNVAVAGLLVGVLIGVALMVSQAVSQIVRLVSSLWF